MKERISLSGKISVLLLLFAGISFISCESNNQKPEIIQLIQPIEIEVKQLKIKTDIHDELERYFEVYSIKPAIEINNIDGNQTSIQLANHKIKWFDANNETKIQIDNDLFSLKNEITINDVWDKKDSVDFSNNWDEIKLFRHKNKEYIGIRMSYFPCNGLGCGIQYYLFYDVATKSKNFFGTFRTDSELELFDFSNDDTIDYVSRSFNGDANGSTPIDFIFELYSLDYNGQFKVKQDSNGISYRIKHTTFPNDPTKPSKYFEHWLSKIITGTV